MTCMRLLDRSFTSLDLDAPVIAPENILDRNAAKNFNYDAQQSSPESSELVSASILCTRSMDFYDRKSFRFDGVEEFDIICRSLGLSGLEDFSIPAEAWEAMKARPSSELNSGGSGIKGVSSPIDDSEEKRDVGEMANQRGDTSSCSSWDLLKDSISTCSTWEVVEVENQRGDTCSSCISPNVRLEPVITPGSWEKGELLGRGSFGTVYEGISQ